MGPQRLVQPGMVLTTPTGPSARDISGPEPTPHNIPAFGSGRANDEASAHQPTEETGEWTEAWPLQVLGITCQNTHICGSPPARREEENPTPPK